MLRPLILSVLVFALVAAGLPVSDSLAAHWSARPHIYRSGSHLRHRHSRAWWRRHRAWLQRRRARALARQRRAAVKAVEIPVERDSRAVNMARTQPRPLTSGRATWPTRSSAATTTTRALYDLRLPRSWSRTSTKVPGEMKFLVRSSDGRSAGTAVIAPVVTAAIAPPTARPSKILGGVLLSTLGRTVIDRMIAEGGWVVNDMVREIEGRRVYTVFAQSGTVGASAPSHSWTFYFTEIDGRIYSLATTAPIEFATPLATDSEQVVASLRPLSSGAVAVKSPY